jgi:hypothetical protein
MGRLPYPAKEGRMAYHVERLTDTQPETLEHYLRCVLLERGEAP